MPDTTIDTAASGDEAATGDRALVPMLVLLWCADAPERSGEVLVPPEEGAVFGRGAASQERAIARLPLLRQRPGENATAPPLETPYVSRSQLRLARDGATIRLENVGKRALVVRGEVTHAATVSPGEIVELKGQCLFLCVRRPRVLPPLHSASPQPSARFGEADAHGFVGESPLAWELRDQIAFIARRGAHVLLLGESGTGKELVARAVHALSSRKDRRLVARNAATLPPGLIDAELFGNVANYPNAGMPERAGLIGEASGSTLFLDEIGELPIDLQTHLLRVLDRGGEYQRLGEAKTRTADLRLVAATNRGVDQLKHDLAARMRLRLTIPGLNDRREDVPLLVRHLLAREAEGDPEIGRRFFEGWNGRSGKPRVATPLVEALVLHRYETHVRELDALLWRSLATSKGDVAELTPEVREELSLPPAARAADPREIDADRIRESLQRNDGVQEKVWRELGLASRHVLTRLMRKHGIAAK